MESAYEPQTCKKLSSTSPIKRTALTTSMLVVPSWKNGVVCPVCGSTAIGFLKNQLRWQCSVRHMVVQNKPLYARRVIEIPDLYHESSEPHRSILYSGFVPLRSWVVLRYRLRHLQL